MANKILNTRVLLRYDSFTNWSANKSSVPLKGEMCICTSGTVNPNVDDVLLKVGDGTTTWENLPWVSAKAADVHEWAKLSWEEFEKRFAADRNVEVEYGTDSKGVPYVKYKHAAISTTKSTSEITPDHGDSFTVIDTIETDAVSGGHVTKVNTKTITLPSIDSIEKAIKHVVVAEGTLIDVEPSTSSDGKTTTYTVNHENIDWTENNLTQSNLGHSDSFTVVTGVEKDAVGHITRLNTAEYTLPEDNDTKYDYTTEMDADKGITVLKSVDGDDKVNFIGSGSVSVSSDAAGNVTIHGVDENDNTTYDLKTDASTTNGKLVLDPSEGDNDTVTFVGSGSISVASDASGKITISGHDTKYALDVVSGGTNIASVKLNADKADQDTVKLIGGDNVTITVSNDDVTISAKDTTYTAGAGLDLSTDNVFSHEDTSSVSDLKKTDRTYVSALTFDEFGHVTAYDVASETVVDTDTDTQTMITNGNKYISVDTTELKVGELNTIKISVVESELKTLIANETTAAMTFMGGTETIPTTANTGDLYKVTKNDSITIDGVKAKVGDSIVYDGSKWHLIPSGDDIEDTWRPVFIGTEGQGGTSEAKSLTLESGEGIILDSASAKTGVAKFSHDDTSNVSDLTKTDRTYVSALTFDKFGHVTGYDVASETITYNNDFDTMIGDTGEYTAVKDGDDFKIAGDKIWTETAVSGNTLTVSHKASGVVAGTVSGTATVASVAHGSTVEIPSITVDAAGHVTAATTTSFVLPTNDDVVINENPNSAALIVEKNNPVADTNGNTTTTYNIYHKQYTPTEESAAKTSLQHGNSFTVITDIDHEEGHVTKLVTTEFSLPEHTESNDFGKVTVSGSSTASSEINAANGTVEADALHDNLKLTAANKWLGLRVDGDEISLGHRYSGVTAGLYAPSFDGTTNKLTVYSTTVDAAGHLTAVTSKDIDLSALKPTKDNDTLGKNVVGASADATVNGAAAGTAVNGTDATGNDLTVAGTVQKVYTADGVHLNHVETLDGESSVVSTHKISGDAFIAVKSDASGNITVGVEQTEGDTLILVCGGAAL